MQSLTEHPHFKKYSIAIVGSLALLIFAVMGLGAHANVRAARANEAYHQMALRAGRIETASVRIQNLMDGAMLAVADRVGSGRRADLWGRPTAWAVRDLSRIPSLHLASITAEDAQRINSLVPVSLTELQSADPFLLKSVGTERERALLCLSQAVYYEAALEPIDGQRAVAQVVLNRMRHPAYPKNVCGVVYQGSDRVTGCQFSFTCDGSVLRTPMQPYWDQAKRVAEEALSGMVANQVGTATFYHADYVLPYWAPSLVKLGQIGRHIFYRFPGPTGGRLAFSGRYSGHELNVSLQVRDPNLIDPLLAGLPEGTLPPGFEAFSLADAGNPAGQTAGLVGSSPMDMARLRGVVAGRRAPTAEEIERINAALSALPQSQAQSQAQPQSPPASQPVTAPSAEAAKAATSAAPTSTPAG